MGECVKFLIQQYRFPTPAGSHVYFECKSLGLIVKDIKPNTHAKRSQERSDLQPERSDPKPERSDLQQAKPSTKRLMKTNPNSRIPNLASRIPHPESRIPNLESRIPYPESRYTSRNTGCCTSFFHSPPVKSGTGTGALP